MKSKLTQLGMLAGLALFMGSNPTSKGRRFNTSDIDTEPNETSKQGHKTFKFKDGFTCTALNQKNADRKHNK